MNPVSRQAPSLRSKLQRAQQGAHPQGAQTLAQRRDRALGAGAPLFYDEPVHIVRGEGVRLVDADGTKYMDMYNNVPCIGHCHPHVVQAVREQAGVLNTHSRYLHEGIVRYAERLVGRHHAGIESVVFTCTGTEAVEVALMMARMATGRRGVICTDAAYHGNSAAVRKLGRATRHSGHDGEARGVPVPETYRTQANDPAAWHLERLREVIRGFARDRAPPAALLVCVKRARLHQSHDQGYANRSNRDYCNELKDDPTPIPAVATVGVHLRQLATCRQATHYDSSNGYAGQGNNERDVDSVLPRHENRTEQKRKRGNLANANDCHVALLRWRHPGHPVSAPIHVPTAAATVR